MLLVEDPSRTNTTEMINSYVQLLTNTQYEMARDNNNVYTVTLTKMQYNLNTNCFEQSSTSSNLKRNSSTNNNIYKW